MPYETVLLDFDHTLFDSDASELAAFAHTRASVGVADPDRLFSGYVAINQALWAAVERHELTPGDVRTRRFEELIERFALDADAEEMADAFVLGLATYGELYAGAADVLAELASRARLALLTNGLSDVQRTRIGRLGISAHFDAVVISAEIGCSKPAAAFFDHAFAALGEPARGGALMVGDSLSADIGGAAAYGLATCWYNPHRRPVRDGARIDHEIRALDQLVALVP